MIIYYFSNNFTLSYALKSEASHFFIFLKKNPKTWKTYPFYLYLCKNNHTTMKTTTSFKSIASNNSPPPIQAGIHLTHPRQRSPASNEFRPGWGRGCLGRANRRGLDARRRLKKSCPHGQFFMVSGVHCDSVSPSTRVTTLYTQNIFPPLFLAV